MTEQSGRSVTLNYSAEKVREALALCHHYIPNASKGKFDDSCQTFTIHCREILSFGSDIIVHVNDENQGVTVLEMEMKRSSELEEATIESGYANRQMEAVSDAVSKILTTADEQVPEFSDGTLAKHQSIKFHSLQNGGGCLFLIGLTAALFFCLSFFVFRSN